MDEGKDGFIALGRISRPHGIKGEVQVYPYSGPESIAGLREIHLRLKSSSLITCKVLRSRIKGPKAVIMSLDGITDRDKAEELRETEILVPRRSLTKSEGEYFWYELEGLEVVTQDGRSLGVIRQIIETGANDVIVVQGPAGEVLLPVIEEVIKQVDIKRKICTVEPLPGLLEIYDL